MASSSVEELRDALRDNLDRSGKLRMLKANVRSAIYAALSTTEAAPTPEPSSETLVINELIREYLLFNNYRETLSVFIPEAGQPEVRPFDRSFLSSHLRMQDGPNSQKLPLLYSLVSGRQQQHSLTPGNETSKMTGQAVTNTATSTQT